MYWSTIDSQIGLVIFIVHVGNGWNARRKKRHVPIWGFIIPYPSIHISPVHVVLVSLLVDQLSGLFLTFFGRPKKICSVSGNFWSVSEFFLVRLWFFGILKRNFGILKRNLVDQKNQRLTRKNSETDTIFFCPVSGTGQFRFGRPQKMIDRPDNWSTKRLTKSTWTPLTLSYNFLIVDFFWSIVCFCTSIGSFQILNSKIFRNILLHPVQGIS